MASHYFGLAIEQADYKTHNRADEDGISPWSRVYRSPVLMFNVQLKMMPIHDHHKGSVTYVYRACKHIFAYVLCPTSRKGQGIKIYHSEGSTYRLSAEA